MQEHNNKFDQILMDRREAVENLKGKKRVIKVGTAVRIMIFKNVFVKGTKPKWSKQIHVVERIETGNHYYVNNRNAYYKDYELQVVSQDPDSFDDFNNNGDDSKSEIDMEDKYDDIEEEKKQRFQRRINREGLLASSEDELKLGQPVRTGAPGANGHSGIFRRRPRRERPRQSVARYGTQNRPHPANYRNQ